MKTSTARQVWKDSPSEFFQQIKAGSLHIIGLMDATLIHNEGWWFAQAGKFIERADKTSRILDLRYETLPEKGAPKTVNQEEALEWSAILRSCSAWDAYKTIHGAEVNPVFVAEFGYPAATMRGVFSWNDAAPGYPLTADGQALFVRDLVAWGTREGVLSGIRPWAPDLAMPGWAPMALFSRQGSLVTARPALDAFTPR